MKDRVALLGALVFLVLGLSHASAGQLSLADIEFFESGQREEPSILERTVHPKAYVQSLTRYIYCTVSFFNSLYKIKDQNVRLSLRGYLSDGSFLGEIYEDLTIGSALYGEVYTKRLPWQEPGNWATGTYSLEVYLDGVYVGKGNFDISLSLDSLNMKFFESGYDLPSRGSQTYATSFAQNSARYIYCEVSFLSSRDQTVHNTEKLSLKYYKPDGSLMGVPSIDIKSDERPNNIWLGWGWQDPGHWAAGTYAVEAYLDGGYIGKSTFDIYGSPSASEDPFDIGKRLAMAARFDEETQTWVKDNWAGDGYTYSFHINYGDKFDLVSFTERPLAGKGLMIMWGKDCRAGVYVKLLGDTASNTLTDTIPITKEQAEREAWRILKYFNY